MNGKPRHRVLWDPDNLWWAVSDGDGCYDTGLGEDEARALAAELNMRFGIERVPLEDGSAADSGG